MMTSLVTSCSKMAGTRYSFPGRISMNLYMTRVSSKGGGGGGGAGEASL